VLADPTFKAIIARALEQHVERGEKHACNLHEQLITATANKNGNTENNKSINSEKEKEKEKEKREKETFRDTKEKAR
jgi:hypothetical protein